MINIYANFNTYGFCLGSKIKHKKSLKQVNTSGSLIIAVMLDFGLGSKSFVIAREGIGGQLGS